MEELFLTLTTMGGAAEVPLVVLGVEATQHLRRYQEVACQSMKPHALEHLHIILIARKVLLIASVMQNTHRKTPQDGSK
jgi:hypothetical protein